MSARDNDLGRAKCPLCGGVAALRLSANGLAYLAMDCCKAQLFTRGPVSDELARDLLITDAPPAQVKPEPAPTPAKPAPEPAPTPAAPPVSAPAPAKPRMAWGLFPNV